jgi:uncharacterized protein YbaP (TraB family)
MIVRVLALIAIAACGSSPARCELPPHTAGAPFLWRVQRANGPVVWLFGTIHDVGIDQVPPSALAALDGAPRFASELGDVEPDPQTLVELARLPYGKVLDQLLPPDDWYDLVDTMRGAMSEDQLRHARPWFAMTRLTNRVAPSPKPSMDDALAARAADHHIPVDALESWQQQMQALADGVDIADLQQAIHARNAIACELARMRAIYASGDAAMLEPLVVVRDQATIIDARNAKWRTQIEGYATAGGAFVAVGVGHLLGSHGLPAVLAAGGFDVERVH